MPFAAGSGSSLAQDKTSNRRIGLLGGSFNPPHEGHREISLTALDRLGLDEVWWLVSPGNPLKDPDIYAPYDERIAAARRVANDARIVVSDFEQRTGVQYTVDTIERLRAAHPDARFVWLMGADSLENFHRWKDWRRIAGAIPIAIFNRPGHGEAALAGEAASALVHARISAEQGASLADARPPAWAYFQDTNNPLSSTELRSRDIAPAMTTDTASASNNDDLTAPCGALAYFLDLHPDIGDFRADVIEGLSQEQKCISPKYFYDERGSKLFARITGLEDYYPTRTEKSLFEDHAAEITGAIGAGAAIFEYGSGSSEKIKWLIDGVETPNSYVAMDISKEHLLESAEALAAELSIPVAAVCADFHAPVRLPENILPAPDHWLGYFPGSTIGNMLPKTAAAFLARAADTLGAGAQILIGVDLVKGRAVLERAYNDREGVTAAFNLNLLTRMVNELGAELNRDDFEHYAFYNEDKARIEMHLRATRATAISVNGQTFSFAPGETLHTENSHKFTPNAFRVLVNKTPWRLENIWTDRRGWYAACLLRNS